MVGILTNFEYDEEEKVLRCLFVSGNKQYGDCVVVSPYGDVEIPSTGSTLGVLLSDANKNKYVMPIQPIKSDKVAGGQYVKDDRRETTIDNSQTLLKKLGLVRLAVRKVSGIIQAVLNVLKLGFARGELSLGRKASIKLVNAAGVKTAHIDIDPDTMTISIGVGLGVDIAGITIDMSGITIHHKLLGALGGQVLTSRSVVCPLMGPLIPFGNPGFRMSV